MKRNKELLIRTPEGIVFPLLIADPVRRLMAYIIDKVAVVILCSLLALALSGLGFFGIDLFGAVVAVGQFVVQLGYGITMEWLWKGQTLGKRYLRVQVMDSQGLRLQFGQVVIRNLLRVVDMLPLFYFVGGLAAVVSSHGQRLGDLLANTIVIQRPEINEPDLEQILPDKFNSFRQYPHLVARLRQNVTPTEAGIALSGLIRRDKLEDNARVTLFEEIRSHLERRARFPEDLTDGISDEQYIRNVVDVLYR